MSQTGFTIVDNYDGDCCCALYAADVVLDCCCPPGDYYIENTVTDEAEGSDTERATFTIEETMYIEVPSSIAFSGVKADEVTISTGYSIHLTGNAQNVKVNVKATDLVGTGGTIPATALDVNGHYDLAGNGADIKDASGDVITFVCCQAVNVDFSIRPPAGTKPDTYIGTITFTPHL